MNKRKLVIINCCAIWACISSGVASEMQEYPPTESSRRVPRDPFWMREALKDAKYVRTIYSDLQKKPKTWIKRSDPAKEAAVLELANVSILKTEYFTRYLEKINYGYKSASTFSQIYDLLFNLSELLINKQIKLSGLEEKLALPNRKVTRWFRDQDWLKLAVLKNGENKDKHVPLRPIPDSQDIIKGEWRSKDPDKEMIVNAIRGLPLFETAYFSNVGIIYQEKTYFTFNKLTSVLEAVGDILIDQHILIKQHTEELENRRSEAPSESRALVAFPLQNGNISHARSNTHYSLPDIN